MEKGIKLGFWSIVLLGINAIIGSGIFGLPGDAYTDIGPASILVLVFCMLLAVSIALCFAEAGSGLILMEVPIFMQKRHLEILLDLKLDL
ncbi:putative membrane protein [Clostridioides difficile F665]|uniref:hypothetical protein n=1 Tax=Clostridioides difficile TaxID=1496 RepID=UPI0003B1EDD7|nr:hypothetical protein [Clostridioides difficile]ERM44853.1 putative membrane protein [Clostridioides difficile F665]